MMKPTSQAAKRASAILLTMLTAAAMPSCQSGQERKDETLRDERRGMIATSGKNRQDNIKAQRKYVGMHENTRSTRAYRRRNPRWRQRVSSSQTGRRQTAKAGGT